MHRPRLTAPEPGDSGRAQDRAQQLRANVASQVMRVHLALSPERQRDDGVEVRAAAPPQRADREQQEVGDLVHLLPTQSGIAIAERSLYRLTPDGYCCSARTALIASRTSA